MKWEDPPPARGGRGKTGQFHDAIKELRSHPGEWARLSEAVSGAYPAAIRRGNCGFSPAGAFEGVVRQFDGTTKRGVLYARYIGEPE